MKRRHFTTLALALFATACANTPSGLTQGLADAQGIVTTLRREVPLIATTLPNLMPVNSSVSPTVVMGWIDTASALLASITPSSPTALSDLNKVMAYIEKVLAVVSAAARQLGSADPQIAAIAVAIDAALALAPVVEALIQAPTNNLAKLKAAARPHATVAQARAILHVPTL